MAVQTDDSIEFLPIVKNKGINLRVCTFFHDTLVLLLGFSPHSIEHWTFPLPDECPTIVVRSGLHSLAELRSLDPSRRGHDRSQLVCCQA